MCYPGGQVQFFAAALCVPSAEATRSDPEALVLANGELASSLVAGAFADIRTARSSGVANEIVTMSSSRMAGGGVLPMALGEYIVHSWDLSTATGKRYAAPEGAAEPALEFLQEQLRPSIEDPTPASLTRRYRFPLTPRRCTSCWVSLAATRSGHPRKSAHRFL